LLVWSWGLFFSSADLEAMRLRAARFGSCVAQKEAVRGLRSREVVLCRSRGVAFLHVFKAAGTTVMDLLLRSCADAQVFATWATKVTLDELQNELGNVTVFTFVRDPLERFQSGLFEVAARGGLAKERRRARDAKKKNRTVASLVAEDLLRRRNRRQGEIDGHLQPQSSFFVDRGALVAPVSFIGRVGAFAEDMTAIGTEVLGLERAAVEDFLRTNHARDSKNASYHPALTGDLRREALDPRTRAILLDFYRIDYDCLSF